MATDWRFCFEEPKQAAELIDRLQEERDHLTGIIDRLTRVALPDEPTPEKVAQFWLDSEGLYYRTTFDPGALTRLTSVVRAARVHGLRCAENWPAIAAQEQDDG